MKKPSKQQEYILRCIYEEQHGQPSALVSRLNYRPVAVLRVLFNRDLVRWGDQHHLTLALTPEGLAIAEKLPSRFTPYWFDE